MNRQQPGPRHGEHWIGVAGVLAGQPVVVHRPAVRGPIKVRLASGRPLGFECGAFTGSQPLFVPAEAVAQDCLLRTGVAAQ